MLVVADTTSVNQKDIQLVLANNRTITFEEDADIKYDKKGGITANTGIEQIKVSKEATKETTLNTLFLKENGQASPWPMAPKYGSILGPHSNFLLHSKQIKGRSG